MMIDPLTLDAFLTEPHLIQALTLLYAVLALLWFVRYLQAFFAIRGARRRHIEEDRLRVVREDLDALTRAWPRSGPSWPLPAHLAKPDQ